MNTGKRNDTPLLLILNPFLDRGLYAGSPYKRIKRAAKAIAARIQFSIDDMYENDALTGERLGEGLLAARRSGIAYSFEHAYGPG